MISVEESRKILGEVGEGMTDKEIVDFRNSWYEIINMLIDDYFEQGKNKGKA